MSFERSFFNSTFAMVGLGVIAADISDPTVLSLVMLGLTMPAIGGAYVWTVRRGGGGPADWVASVFSLLAFVAAVAAAVAWFNVLSPFLHFLSFVQCLKLWQRKTARDFGCLYAVSIIQVACGASISLDIQFGLLFLVYLVVGFWTLILFYLKREADQGAGLFLRREAARSLASLSASQVRRAMGWGLPAMLAILIAGIVGLFLVLPRYHIRVLNVATPASSRALVGFTPHIQLGEIGEIMDNAQPVMRVRLSRGDSPVQVDERALLWRGVSADSYSHGEWRITRFQNFTLVWRDGLWQNPRSQGWFNSIDGRFRYPYDRQAWPPMPNVDYPLEDDLCQDITLESTGSRVLFALYPPVDFTMILPQETQEMALDVQHWNASFDWVTSRLCYRVFSRPPRWTEEELNGAALTPASLTSLMRIYFIELPPELESDGRLPALARRIVSEARAETPYQQVAAVRRWLERNCRYTRLPGVARTGQAEREDPILRFLFETRKGHCEYFATAQVLLTRALRIPARVVNGFRGGEWNDLGQFYLVRQRDAHSWAEVYLDKIGWHAVDPSPREDDSSRLSPARFLTRYFDFLQQVYDRSIIQYRPAQSERLSSELGQLLFDMRAILGQPGRALSFGSWEGGQTLLGQAVVLVLSLGAVAALAGLAIAALRFRWPGLGPRPDTPESRLRVPFYQETLRLLKQRGLDRPGHLTPGEFAEHVVSSRGTALEPVRTLTRLYYAARFSGRSLTPEEWNAVSRQLAALREALR